MIVSSTSRISLVLLGSTIIGKSDFKDSIVEISKIQLASSTSYFSTIVLSLILANDSDNLIIASSYLTVIGICFLFSFLNDLTLALWSTYKFYNISDDSSPNLGKHFFQA